MCHEKRRKETSITENSYYGEGVTEATEFKIRRLFYGDKTYLNINSIYQKQNQFLQYQTKILS